MSKERLLIEYTPEERERNIGIAHRLKKLFDLGKKNEDLDFYVEFEPILDRKMSLQIFQCDEVDDSFIGLVPEELTHPAYGFFLWKYDTPPLIRHLYDGRILPSVFIGRDDEEGDKLYLVHIWDVFDLQGNAVSVEDIQSIEEERSIHEALDWFYGYGDGTGFGIPSGIPRINFGVKEGNEHSDVPVPVSEETYKKVLFHLDLIDRGQFVEVT